MAFGVALMAGTPDYRQNLLGYLFGNILLVRDADLVLAAVLVGGASWSPSSSSRSSSSSASTRRPPAPPDSPPTRLRYLLLTLLAVTIVSAIKVVGIVLVSAFLVIPAATAQLVAPSMRAMMGLSVVFALVFALVAVVGGLWIALVVMDLPRRPAAIVLTGRRRTLLRGTHWWASG
jgi:zinc transport system permease protein